MSKIAFLFPGQASQYPGMGRDLAEKFPAARKVFESADAALGFSLSHVCFEGSEEELKTHGKYATRHPDCFHRGFSGARRKRCNAGFCGGAQPGRVFGTGCGREPGFQRGGETGARARTLHAGGRGAWRRCDGGDSGTCARGSCEDLQKSGGRANCRARKPEFLGADGDFRQCRGGEARGGDCFAERSEARGDVAGVRAVPLRVDEAGGNRAWNAICARHSSGRCAFR